MTKTIQIDLYSTTLILVVGSLPKLRQVLLNDQEYEEFAKDVRPYTTGKTVLLSHGDVVMWVYSSYDVRAIANEIFHAVYLVMDKVGIILTDGSDEAFAYLAGYISEKVFFAIKNETKEHQDEPMA